MSQSAQILDHLQRRGQITALEALSRYGCLRLAARVRDLRDSGYPVRSHMVHDGRKKWAVYTLGGQA